MQKITKKILISVLILSLITLSFGSFAYAKSDYEESDPGGAAMFADFIIIRPLGIISTVLGSALFVVSLPFTALGQNVGPAYEKMVVTPAKFTFERPLGHL